MSATPPLHPKDRSQQVNPDSSIAHAAAFRTVLLYTITDTFDLLDEEVVWSGFQLDALLSPLVAYRPDSVPLPVRLEMLDGAYSRLIAARVSLGAAAPSRNGSATAIPQASLTEWCDAILAPVLGSYSLNLSDQAQIQAGMTSLLAELGVGDPVNPRAATHLPREMRNLGMESPLPRAV